MEEKDLAMEIGDIIKSVKTLNRCQDAAKNPLGKISILFEYYFVFSFKISFFIHLNFPLDLPLENLNSEDWGLC